MEIISNKKLGKPRKALNSFGLRLTSQRKLLMDIIQRGEDHPDAYDIYRLAKKKQPKISLSTVYRSLQMFKKLGLIEELHLTEEHHHYEVKSSSDHHHLVCIGCGGVIEFECPLTRKIQEDVGAEKDFEVIGIKTLMTGFCARCRAKKG
jgi:Fe2+ or Zn2+ uptake regulation protein